MANAESQVKTCQINVTNEEQKVEDAQKQFDQAKEKYDRFMATQPSLTNAVYLKIRKDLNLLLRQSTFEQERIAGLQERIAGLKMALPCRVILSSLPQIAGKLPSASEIDRPAYHGPFPKPRATGLLK